MKTNTQGAAAYLGARRILANLTRRKLDAERQRDTAARTSNAVAAYAFALLAEEMAAALRDAEAIFAEEKGVAAAYDGIHEGGACHAIFQHSRERVTRRCVAAKGHPGEHTGPAVRG